MKKSLLFLLLIFMGTSLACFATDKIRVSPEVYKGISLYKQGNYAGCIQEMQKAQTSMKDASIPYYYMGNAYIQLGRTDDAKAAYGKVVELNKNSGLVILAKNATEYLTNAEEYAKSNDMATFINSRKFLHPEVVKDLEDKEIQSAVQEINAKSNKGDSVDFSKYKYLNDASQNMPTDEEIAQAVKVLARVGYNPYGNMNFNSDYTTMNSIIGQNPSVGGDFSNMLPYLMAQNNQRGNSGSTNPNVNQQLMQTMMLKQMTSGF